MASIYRRARSVILWTGLEDAESNIAVAYLQQTLTSADEELQSTNLAWPKHCVTSFLDRDYWKKMWIVQEVLLARDILCFAGATSFFMERPLDLWPEVLGGPPGRSVLEQATTIHRAPTSSSSVNIFYGWRGQKCHDRRDRIFALLGLLAENDKWFKPDYSVSYETMCMDNMYHLVEIVESPMEWMVKALKLARVLDVDIGHAEA